MNVEIAGNGMKEPQARIGGVIQPVFLPSGNMLGIRPFRT